LYLLGDYIDRGPDSKGVLDKIIQLRADGYRVVTLLGNHEQLLIQSLADEVEKTDLWLLNGGVAALRSFGVEKADDIPECYLQWLQQLEVCAIQGQYILVHAGLNFRNQNPLRSVAEMIWIRNWYAQINYEWLGDRIIIHGHTPLAKTAIEEQLRRLPQQQYLDIDNGCVYHPAGQSRGLGALCAFDMTHQQLYFEENREGLY
jgi:serine/threonine protein phosphatase 1